MQSHDHILLQFRSVCGGFSGQSAISRISRGTAAIDLGPSELLCSEAGNRLASR